MTATQTDETAIRKYEAMRAAFRWEVPEYYNFAVDTVGEWAADPTRLAMLHVDRAGHERYLTFADFAARSDQLANALRQRGIGVGDRVIVALPRIPEWYEALLALMKLGAITIPSTPLLTARDFEYRIQAAGAKGIIADGEVAEQVDQITERCPTLDLPCVVGDTRQGWVNYEAALAAAPTGFVPVRTCSSDPCLIYFTSGTTARPKMVVHNHAYPIGHRPLGQYIFAFGPDTPPGELNWVLSDGGWVSAAYVLCAAWNFGQALFIKDIRGRIDPAGMLSLLERYPIASFSAPPTLFRMLIQQDLTQFKPKALRQSGGGGEPFNPEILAAWHAATGLLIREVYGQTESPVLIGSFPPAPIRPGSLGRPAPGCEVGIVDDEGRALPPGEEGHLAVRLHPTPPPGLFQGYWDDPELTERTFAGEWYLTGDRMRMDEDGYFWFVGRADDVIKSSGYRISPFEVESMLLEHPAVAESAVVATPDPIRGNLVKAFVALAPGYAPSDELAREIQDFVKAQTAPYKYPREIEFVLELPKTISGKIRRVELRQREIERKGMGVPVA